MAQLIDPGHTPGILEKNKVRCGTPVDVLQFDNILPRRR
jgi:hypothetical protein